MTDKPETKKQEPTPRPPRQPDMSLITYLERGDDKEDEAESSEPRRR
ncbi:MAG: hypothetical protein U9N56_00820 [Actinomycetota bacterium]|nr:hypothetical protein [Actinomycetota bacterium]